MAKPASVREIAQDDGFRRVARRRRGIDRRLPATAPDQHARTLTQRVAVAKTTHELPPELGTPALHDVVSARYGDGPDSITISTRRGRLNELLTNTGLQGSGARRLKLTRGPLVSDYAYVSTDPLRNARFAAYHQGLVIQITAPSAHDAITVAESLRAAR